MPKLNATHLPERIRTRLEQLKSGVEVAQRDLRALLTAEQAASIDALWAEQQALRKKKRARTKEEEAALGWKSKREVHIQVLEDALSTAVENEPETWLLRLRKAEVRQARIYFEEWSEQLASGVDTNTAKARANNALTRAGLRRIDGVSVQGRGLTARDRELQAMEQDILTRMAEKAEKQESESRKTKKSTKDSGVVRKRRSAK